MLFIQIINLFIRFYLILSKETYIKNESVFYLPDYFGKLDQFFVYPRMREINAENGRFDLSFRRRHKWYLVRPFDYMIYNISNKITSASFEGINPKDILEREKPNELIIFKQMIPFLKFTKNLGYIKKAILGMEYLKGVTRKYLPEEEYFYEQYLGGLPESIKKKYNYRESFKIKEIILDDCWDTYEYIIEEKVLNMRFDFENSTSVYSNEEIENISMCFECFDSKFLYHGKKPQYVKSLIQEYKQKKILNYDSQGFRLSFGKEDSKFIPNYTLFFDGKEITFPKSSFEDYVNGIFWDYSFGFDFFWLFNATEIDYDNHIIIFYSDKEIFKHSDKGNNVKKIKYNIFTNFIGVFIIFVAFILYLRNKIRKENQENYEKYFNMEKL